MRNPLNKSLGDFLQTTSTTNLVDYFVIRFFPTRFVVDSKF